MQLGKNWKSAKDLKKGDVLQSGEVLTADAQKLGSFQNKKALVSLRNPKTGRTRVATWGYYSTIFLSKGLTSSAT